MTRLWVAMGTAALAATASAQSLFKNQPARIAVEARVEGTLGAPTRAAQVNLVATPVAGVHVYAPGNSDYIPVTVTVTPVEGLTIGAPDFPAGEHYFFAPLKQAVKVYSKPFRIVIPVTASAAFLKRATGREPVALKGVVSYQACDDKVCFPPQTQPFSVDVPLKPARR